MAVTTESRRWLTTLAGLVALAIGLGFAISAAVASSPGSTETSVAAPDNSPNPWEMNDPGWAVWFLQTYCPDGPQPGPEQTDEIVAAIGACRAEPPSRSPVASTSSPGADVPHAAAAADGGPDAWEMNDPDWALRFLGTYCPWTPLPALEPGEIVDAVRTCSALRNGALENLAASLR
jgi:hypothetical protein